jgi:hypothetical protein
MFMSAAPRLVEETNATGPVSVGRLRLDDIESHLSMPTKRPPSQQQQPSITHEVFPISVVFTQEQVRVGACWKVLFEIGSCVSDATQFHWKLEATTTTTTTTAFLFQAPDTKIEMEHRVASCGASSFPGRLMALHGTNLFPSTEDWGVLLGHLGLQMVGPNFLGAAKVTDVSWQFPMGSALCQGVDAVELEKPYDDDLEHGEGHVVTLCGSRHFADVEMKLGRRLKMSFFVQDDDTKTRCLPTGEEMLKIEHEEELDDDGEPFHWVERRPVPFRSAVLFPDVVEPRKPECPIECELFRSETFLHKKQSHCFEEIDEFVAWCFFEDGLEVFEEPSGEEARIECCKSVFGIDDEEMEAVLEEIEAHKTMCKTTNPTMPADANVPTSRAM